MPAEALPVNSPVIINVTPPATPPVTINEIVVGNLNLPKVAYHHTQNITSSNWVISHRLGFKPNVTVVDSAGTIVEGEITYTDSDTLTLHFTEAFTGKAYLS